MRLTVLHEDGGLRAQYINSYPIFVDSDWSDFYVYGFSDGARLVTISYLKDPGLRDIHALVKDGQVYTRPKALIDKYRLAGQKLRNSNPGFDLSEDDPEDLRVLEMVLKELVDEDLLSSRRAQFIRNELIEQDFPSQKPRKIQDVREDTGKDLEALYFYAFVVYLSREGGYETRYIYVYGFSDGTTLVSMPGMSSKIATLVRDGVAYTGPDALIQRYLDPGAAAVERLRRHKTVKERPGDREAIRLALNELEDEGYMPAHIAELTREALAAKKYDIREDRED